MAGKDRGGVPLRLTAIEGAALAFITLLAAWLRLRGLGDQSLWLDEAVAWRQTKGSALDVISATAGDNFPPLSNLSMWASRRMFGDTAWAMRLPSAVAGLATVLALFWLGRRVGGVWCGLLAALLLAIHPFHIWYSQEARMYALLALGSTLAAIAAWETVQRPTPLRTLSLAVCGAMLLYTHIFGALVLVALTAGAILVWLGQPERQRHAPLAFAIGLGLAGMSFLPWTMVMARRIVHVTTGGFWIPPLSTQQFVGTLSGLAGGSEWLALLLLATIPAFIVLRPRASTLFLLCWAYLPLLGAVLISALLVPLLLDRYLIGSLPALVLIAAAGLTGLGRLVPRPLAGVALAGLVVGLIVGGNGPPLRENWRAAAAELARVGERDCIVLVTAQIGTPLELYYDLDRPCVVGANTPDELALPNPSPERVFLVLAHAGRLGAEARRILGAGRTHVGDIVIDQHITIAEFAAPADSN